MYRGAYPTLRNFAFLRKLKLKKMISLIPEEDVTLDVKQFCRDMEIENKIYNAQKYVSDNVTIQVETVKDVLYDILSSEGKVYVHCLDGSNVVGIVIAVLRKLQHWQMNKILSEFCRFTRDTNIEKEEVEYIMNFSVEIQLPRKIPYWLWYGKVPSKHPSMKIKYDEEFMLEQSEKQEEMAKKEESSELKVFNEVVVQLQHRFHDHTVNSTQDDSTTLGKKAVIGETTRYMQALDIVGIPHNKDYTHT